MTDDGEFSDGLRNLLIDQYSAAEDLNKQLQFYEDCKGPPKELCDTVDNCKAPDKEYCNTMKNNTKAILAS